MMNQRGHRGSGKTTAHNAEHRGRVHFCARMRLFYFKKAGKLLILLVVFISGAMSCLNVGINSPPGFLTLLLLNQPYSRQARFVYVANTNNISMYSVDPITGLLTSIGVTSLTGNFSAVATDTTGKYLYAANESGYNVIIFRINQINGSLSWIGTTTSVMSPTGIAVDPYNRFVFVEGNSSSLVTTFRISALDGALSQIQTTGILLTPFSICVEPTGNFVYTGNGGNSNITFLSIDQSTGHTTLLNSISSGNQTNRVTVDPMGKNLYAANSSAASVTMYSIVSNGMLESLGSGSVPTIGSPSAIIVDPNRRFAFVPVSGSLNKILTFAIEESNGILTEISGIDTVSGSESIAIEPGGKFLYVTNSTSDIMSMFAVNSSTGVLATMGTVGTPAGSKGIAIVSY